MRIPLDYYRILGLPIQATGEQLQQAYQDRALQLPRREYSEVAIAARKHLLDEAYGVLSDPEQRAKYDASFLASGEPEKAEAAPASDEAEQPDPDLAVKPTPPNLDAYSPTLEIAPEKLVGALLIFHELGEYELVLKLSRPYISNGSLSISLDKGRLGDPHLVRPDIVLTMALACLEMGREQWQQGQYENAAFSLETGQKLLLSEGVFPSVRGEIQADIYKLRPYRILELLALPEENAAERRQGLRLLQDMLEERGGIDGTGDDRSGLSVDDFLRFIQQLRSYLTSDEQQALFEAEAKRPSAVAIYLAVYAAIASGFSQRQAASIAQAKEMLLLLGKRQDVHLEQAVCALLLGQTEEATRALDLSQEYEPLAFIREHSEGSPDFLPGLCLYAERWLEREVFPQFRDLSAQKVSLKDYFADEQLQAELESLPAQTPIASNLDDAVVEPQPAATTTSWTTTPDAIASPVASESPEGELLVEPSPASATVSATTTTTVISTDEPSSGADVSTLLTDPRTLASTQTAAYSKTTLRESASRQRRQERSRKQIPIPPGHPPKQPDPVVENGLSSDSMPNRLLPSRLKRRKPKNSIKTGRLLFLGFVGFLSLLALGILTRAFFSWINPPARTSATPEQERSQTVPQASPTPTPTPVSASLEGDLTPETAQLVVERWLSTKANALGPNYQVEQLPEILANPALSRWQQTAQTARNNNAHWQYKHSSEITSATASDTNPNRGTIEAVVKEAAEFYEAGTLNRAASYNSNLRVRYDLIRQEGQWRIRDINVLK